MSPLVSTITLLASIGTVLAGLCTLALLALRFIPAIRTSAWGADISARVASASLPLALAVVCASIGLSLFYSDVAGFFPCLLCWWQRVALYPQVVLLAVALATRDQGVRKYCGALSLVGMALALYHSYLQFGGSPLVPCDISITSVACTHRYFLEFGYVTIPTMALTAFLLIATLMLFKKAAPSAATL